MIPEREAIWFPDWKAALAAEAWPAEKTGAFRREVLSFLHHCKVRRAPATVMLMKQYLPEEERQRAKLARPGVARILSGGPPARRAPRRGRRMDGRTTGGIG